MNSRTLAVALVALVVVTAAVVAILWGTRKNVVAVHGEITRVRTHEIDTESSIAIVDLKINNPSGQYFGVRDVELRLEAADGTRPDAAVMAEMDAQRLFSYYPVLGPKTASTLRIGDRINAGETADRMVAARLSTPAKGIADRKSLRIIVTETDGRKSEIVERRE